MRPDRRDARRIARAPVTGEGRSRALGGRGLRCVLPDIELLVVDDDRGIRETLGEVLRDERYSVRLARNGQEALALLEQGPVPSLILLDLAMPGLDGDGFLEQQKRDPRLRQIPVVVFSADDRAPHTQAAGWLRKPVDLEDLLETVARLAGTP
jgi:two-component system, chemotaxis family, chemotaxis protein CheY